MFGKELSLEAVKIYERGLSDLTVEQVEAACKSALLELKFFPKIADIRERIVETAKLELAAKNETEWAEIWKRSADFDPDSGTKFRDDGLSDCAKWAAGIMGGWRQLANAKLKDEPFLRKRFIELCGMYKHSDESKLLDAGESQKQIAGEVSCKN